MQLKKHEHSLKSIETKIDDLKVKLNQVKKNEEYKALQNQIAHDNAAKAKIEEDILLAYEVDRNQDRRGRASSRTRSNGPPPRSRPSSSSSTSRSSPTRPSSRSSRRRSSRPRPLIPEEYREKYRRIVGRYGADALAACEDASCHGCFTSLTSQMINDLINGEGLIVLPELRPAALPDRARGREHATHRDVAIARITVTRRRARTPRCRSPQTRTPREIDRLAIDLATSMLAQRLDPLTRSPATL